MSKNDLQILVFLHLLALRRVLCRNLGFLLLNGNIEKTSLHFTMGYFIAVKGVWLDSLFVHCFLVVYRLGHQLNELGFRVFLHGLSLLNLLLRSSLVLLIWYLTLTKNRLLGLFDLFLECFAILLPLLYYVILNLANSITSSHSDRELGVYLYELGFRFL